MKFLIQCRFCGTILFKTRELITRNLITEIKCSNPKCKKILKLPEDTIATAEKEKLKLKGIMVEERTIIRRKKI